MKWDLKSIITLSLVLATEILVLAYFFKFGDLDDKLFVLFSNLVTNCFTYYFTRKSLDTSKNE